jgi:hypothetical protein
MTGSGEEVQVDACGPTRNTQLYALRARFVTALCLMYPEATSGPRAIGRLLEEVVNPGADGGGP